MVHSFKKFLLLFLVVVGFILGEKCFIMSDLNDF